jgi:magnesium transporter
VRRSADAHATRTFHADGVSVVFVLRCYVESETPADEAAYRLRPLKVYVLVTGEYLVTLHDARVSLPSVLAPDLPEERSTRYAVYSVVDAMLASTFEALEEIELRLDAFASTVKRLVASVDAAANGAGMLLDLQLNERAYLISLLATIFAPLTFLTGFFGMNFGWMTDQIDTQIAFWLVGIVVPIALALLCWRLLARRFLIGGPPREH